MTYHYNRWMSLLLGLAILCTFWSVTEIHARGSTAESAPTAPPSPANTAIDTEPADQGLTESGEAPEQTTEEPASEASGDPDPTEASDIPEDPYLVGWLELTGELRDGPPPYAWIDPEEMEMSLQRVVTKLRHVAEDDRFLGVVIHLQNPRISRSQIYEISRVIQRVRDAGRKVMIFSDHYDMRLYLLGCATDRILLQRKGIIELAGIGVEEIYLGGLLEKLGMKADLIQIGKFKGADEQLTRTGPSDAWSKNIDELLDGIYTQIIEQISTGRHMTREQVEKLLTDCWTYTDEQYLQNGVIDALTDRDLIEETSEQFGDDFEWEDLLDWAGSRKSPETPFALFRKMFQEQQARVHRPSLAIIHARGAIHGGESGSSGPFRGDSIGSRTLTRALQEAKDNDLIKGAIIRIDSPGGSALASELIWQAVRELSEEKPVYVSVSSLALSGGYYIASAADEIYVTPGTLVGSIGVVGGKIVIGRLYDKLGVTVHRRSRGPWGDMFNSVEPFTTEQRTTLLSAFNRVYEQFTDRVMMGRGKRVTDIALVAQGRLFTGRESVRLGLADKIGGIETAIDDLAAELGLDAGQFDLIDLPPPQSLSEFLEDMFETSANAGVNNAGSAGAGFLGSIRAVLGADRWRVVSPIITGLMMLNREPVLMLNPTAIVID